MNIAPYEVARIRGTIYEATKALEKIAGPNNLLVRRLIDELKLCLSVVEQPHPNDEPLRNALIMLFMAMVDGDDGFIPKDKDLYRSAMRRLRETIKKLHEHQ